MKPAESRRFRPPAAARCRTVEVEVSPPWPYRLPGAARDLSMRRREHGLAVAVLAGRSPVLVRAWHAERHRVTIRAEPVPPAAMEGGPGRSSAVPGERLEPARPEQLELAIERVRFALGVDYDLGPFYRAFKHDPLVGRAVRRRPWLRPRRRPWPWEAFSWAVVEQLIEAERAAAIQRRIVRRWGLRLGPDRRGALHVPPSAEVMAGAAPAELAALDLAPKRAAALSRSAREVARGNVDLLDPRHDARLLAIAEIGPWTVQKLGLAGRGDSDSLPAGDLAYLKLVGRLAGLGRRATVSEVEDFFTPYAPYRGLAGYFALVASKSSAVPPLRRLRAAA